ncbi:MAG: hypothetical protein IID18_09865, partial [Nitrospinae bacterium]|nr:hypothetical protein [Nitrospinota bacterium]
MPRVAIRCKASVSGGMGHVHRQVRLGNLLREQGWEVSVYVTDFSPAIELFTRSGFNPHTVDPESALPGEAGETFDLAILDIQDTTEPFIQSMKKRARWLAGFEDLGAG